MSMVIIIHLHIRQLYIQYLRLSDSSILNSLT